MKKILYLSFYFEPDLCAGSFRNTPLAIELAKQTLGQAAVHVMTTLPNRYSTFSTEAKHEEQKDNLFIRRIALPPHKSGFKDQILSFKHYYQEVKRLTKDSQYDLVFASSSRLFTAYLGYTIAQQQNVPLYLDIRDVFTDTLNDVIPNKVIKSVLLPILRWIERRTFQSAKHINLISGGFKEYFQQYNQPAYTYFTNGIDPEFIEPNIDSYKEQGDPIVITYAGNIGEGQGLHKIIPEAAKILGPGYFFRIIGDGGAKKQLLSTIETLGVYNVSLENPVKRSALLTIYEQSDYLLMHLNDYKAFEKVLPSKVFELGALPRPMIAGVNGFARVFIQQHIPDAILVPPADSHAFVAAIREHRFNRIDRRGFIEEFNRKKINAEMAKSIRLYL